MWVKDHSLIETLQKKCKLFADKIAYIQARASDNPHLSQSYIDALNTLPEKLKKGIPRRRLEYIRRSVLAEFRTDKHVIEPV